MAQKKYILQIQLLSDTLIGGTEGFGSVIDKDSVFDEVGLPLIPGKRVKGILREQADLLGKNSFLNNAIDNLLGNSGQTDKAIEYLSVSNFTLPDYQVNKSALQYLINKGRISRPEVIKHFTTIRMMTSIDDYGLAKETSLRTFRVLKKGFVFTGELTFDPLHYDDLKNMVALTRRIGSIRNRGLGHIQCQLIEKVAPVDESEKS